MLKLYPSSFIFDSVGFLVVVHYMNLLAYLNVSS